MRTTPFEDHWPWYFRLFIRVLDERCRWVIAADSPRKSFICEPFKGPDSEVETFVAKAPVSPCELHSWRKAKYPVRNTTQILNYYSRAFERASAICREVPGGEQRIFVLLLRSAQHNDCGIVVHCHAQAQADNDAGEPVFHTGQYRGRIDFRRVADGSLQTSEWPPKEVRSSEKTSDVLERVANTARLRATARRENGRG